MVFTPKVFPYAVIELDLSIARSDLAQGSLTIRGSTVGVWAANILSVITLDGGSLSFRLNDDDNDSIDASDNLKTEGTPFTEIYWTNTAQAGLTAKIYVAQVD